ncbi:hypothetical protein VHUM_03301 [Vanrija humicola]|uniref:Dihydrofolate reductase n=1 Tax=Vanrija humicola TaxID=5417 RepID=A0A7D8UXL5_VANHU|nr:hypothetical protein VHUM_03301 [Vanrija humicola]
MPPPRSITAIVAATLDNGIGREGGLPWRLPGEMKYFARVTTGDALPAHTHNAVIMGRKTWDGIPPKFRPLKDRHNLVVSRAGVDVGDAALTTPHNSLEAAISSVPDSTHRTFLIGGAQLYNQSLPQHVDRVLLTRVLESLPCDAFLDDFTADKRWRRAPHAELREWVGWEVPEGDVEEKGIRYRFEMWVKDL